jgi:SAM-dependent methyltransferase
MAGVLRPTASEALGEWARRVRANREQAERFREAPERADFYAPVAQVFAADPRRTDEPALDLLREMVQPNDLWLDIGAGGGRYALPIALAAREVIAVDVSDAMLKVLRDGAAKNGIENVRIVQSRWPTEEPIQADVSLISHVGYDIEEFGPFLDAMEAATRRTCVAILLSESPAQVAARFWLRIHGEEREPLPALAEFISLLLARGHFFDLKMLTRPTQGYATLDAAGAFFRQQLFIEPGGAKDKELQAILASELEERDGRYALLAGDTPLGVVTWSPG